MVNNASKEQRVGSAIFYGVVSCTLMLLNKQIFAVGFPSHKALALAQMFTTCVVLTVLRLLGKVQFPAPSIASVKAVFPLPLFFLLNLVAGLGGTASLSLPMFTSLRRFSIWFTLIAERYVFGTQHSFSIKMAVGTMVLGSLVAAMNDLAFDSAGYFYATVNNFATAGNGISTKLKLEAKNLGVAGVLFYNSLLSMLILATYVVLFDMENFNESRAFAGWSSPSFVLMFGELLYNVLSLSLSLSDLRSHVLSHSPTSFSAPLALSLSRSLALSLSRSPALSLSRSLALSLSRSLALSLSLSLLAQANTSGTSRVSPRAASRLFQHRHLFLLRCHTTSSPRRTVSPRVTSAAAISRAAGCYSSCSLASLPLCS